MSTVSSSVSASANLEAELNCSVCLSIYKDPVLLCCGHNFCKSCLGRVWDNQKPGKGYSCPECRTLYQQYPVPQRNIKLANIIDCFKATRDSSEPLESEVPLPDQGGAIDVSRKDTQGKMPLMNRCPEHGKPLEYFCRQHGLCLCETCREGHQNHNLQELKKAVAEKRATLTEEIERLVQAQELLQEMVSWLQDARMQVKADRSRLKDQISRLFEEIKEMFKAEECSILDSITAEENIQDSQLESRIRETETKWEIAEQLLQEAWALEKESMEAWEFLGSFPKTLDMVLKADIHVQACTLHKWEMDRASVSQVRKDGQGLARSLGKLIRGRLGQGREVLLKLDTPAPSKRWVKKTDTKVKVSGFQQAKLTLDLNTAHCNLNVSRDLSTANWVEQRHALPAHPERFRLHPQVLCTQGFSTGQHCWEVELEGNKKWEVGATCKVLGQSWVDSCISWVLRWDGRQLQAFEGTSRYSNPGLSSVCQAPKIIKVYLDCERGTLSFRAVEKETTVNQEGSLPAKETGKMLHIFHIKPHGPVYPGFYLEQSSVRIL
ncbi:E3 ubiquitin-protein ligase TRIM39-like [Amia ocellicauda]|uniref:E3 ubiquitin-protein ligase TRIM39-like n=1 Tax=Amia ocellicauda TaxID=2972642 RepID=UPI003464B676